MLAAAIWLGPGVGLETWAQASPSTIDPATGLPVPNPGKSLALLASAVLDPNTALPYELPEKVAAKKIPEIKFDGLPFDEVVKFLRDKFPEMNFLVPPRVAMKANEMQIGLQLRNVGLRDLLTAVAYATDGEITWNLVQENLISFLVSDDLHPGETRQKSGSGAPQPPPPPPPAPPTNPAPPVNRTIQVLNLSSLLRGPGSQDERQALLKEVRQITEQSLQQLYDNFDPKTQMSTANYHPGTGVLILVGPDYANRVFLDILRNMEAVRRPTGGTGVEIKDRPAAPAEAPGSK